MENTKRKLTVVFLIVAFAVFNVLSFTPKVAADEIENLQDDISSVQKKIEKTQTELDKAQSLLQQNKSQVNVTQNLLQKTEAEISQKENELKNLNNRIELSKKF